MKFKAARVFSIFTLIVGGLWLTPVAASQAEFPMRTISGLIIDDGIHSDYYLGDVEAERDSVDRVPLYFVSDGTVRSIDIPFADLSPIVRYSGPDQLTFYTSPPSPDPDVPRPPIAGSVTLPQGLRDVVLMFFTEDPVARRFRVLALDDSLTTFPQSSIRLYNFSAGPLAIEFGEQRRQLQPNRMEVVPFSAEEDYQRLRIARYDSEADRWRVDHSRHIRTRAGTRTTFLVFRRPGRNPDRIMVRRVQDAVSQRQRDFERSGGEATEVEMEE